MDDPDDLEAMSVVSERYHGTAMASLILHGDRKYCGAPALEATPCAPGSVCAGEWP